MTRGTLALEAVHVRRAPGFEDRSLQVEDLSAGVNLIHGPNASGKTTIARSIQSLLWPSEASPHATILGRFRLEDQDWRVEVTSQQASYQRDGHEAGVPGLPPADQRDRYDLALHDLLQKDTKNTSFAQAIRRETEGGYDLVEAAKNLAFTNTPTNRQKGEVKGARKATAAWRDARQYVDEIRAAEKRLPGLERELGKIRQARARIELLDRAIENARARDQLAQGQATLETFPAILEELDGGEAERVEELNERIAGWEEQRAEAAQAKADASATIEGTGLSADGVPDGLISRLKKRRDDLSGLESKVQDQEVALAEAEKRRGDADGELPGEVETDRLASIDPVAWGEASKLAREAERVQADREAYEATQRWLKETESPPEDLDTLERARTSLENWLHASPEVTVVDAGRLRTLAVLSALLVAGAGAVLGLLVHPAFYLTILAAGGLLWYGFQGGTGDVGASTGSGRGDQRSAHRKRIEELNLKPPSKWEPEAVRARLAEIQAAIAQHKLGEARRQRLKALQDDISELEAREATLEEARRALQDRFGVAPDTSEVELFMLAQAVSRWQRANGDVLGLEESLNTLRGQVAELCGKLEEDLEPYGYPTVTDAAEATGHIRNLETRATEHAGAREALKRAEETIEAAATRIEDLAQKRDQVFANVGLDPGDAGELERLCEQADAYHDAAEDVAGAELLLGEATRRLEELPGFEPGLAAETAPALEQAKREAQEIAAQYEDLLQEKSEIETTIKQAKQAHAVEDALADKQRALDALEAQLEKDYAAMVGDALANRVGEATTEASRPKVFEHASHILEQITNERYKLDLEPDGTSFRAYDTIKGEGFAFDALSSATRLQVLLAVRIAFVEHHEEGTKLPLLLDETLANTDDRKARTIIRSAIRLAEDGRQVFYFTAQGDEVAKWLAELEGHEVDHAVIDLAQLQDLDDHVRIPSLAEVSVHTPTPPDPEGHDHASYGEALGVEPFNPRQGPGAAHVWYVVEDVDVLHHLLTLGIERWGQLETLMERGGGELVSHDANTLEQLHCQGLALSAFVRAWRQGRGDLVDRQALETSGAVSDTFIDELTQLAEGCNGDAGEIIQALRAGKVDRFRTGKMDELEAFFEETGYIDPAEPLPPEQIRLRMMQRLVSSEGGREDMAAAVDGLLARLSSRA